MSLRKPFASRTGALRSLASSRSRTNSAASAGVSILNWTCKGKEVVKGAKDHDRHCLSSGTHHKINVRTQTRTS